MSAVRQVRIIQAHKQVALVCALAVFAIGVLSIPFGAAQLEEYRAFLPAFGSANILIDLLTAALLFAQATATLDRPTLHLAAAYLFSVIVIVPHLLAFPGAFADAPIIGASASSVWLWCIWHAGFAILVCRHALTPAAEPNPAKRPRIRIMPTIAAITGTVLILTLAATIGLPYLPTIIVGRNFARLNSTGIGPFVILTNVAALILLLVRMRLRTILAVWLTLAMTAATLDTLLTLSGAGRFTVGWYAARGLSVATGVTVLIALLSEFTILYARTAAANRSLEILSRTDPLTRIPNRRAFDESLDVEWRRAKRDETPLAILVIDIDFFKTFNDTYGHPAGDECLRAVAAALRDVPQRGGDAAARIGGEEFAILLPNTEQYGAASIASRIHTAIAAIDLPHAGNPNGRVTISIGLATSHGSPVPTTAADMVQAADHALYQAKLGGRNRTHLAPTFAGLAPAEKMLASS